MNTNIEKYGRLVDDGDSGDYKRSFIVSDSQEISLEVDTDDCDSEQARAFKMALIEVWNEQRDTGTSVSDRGGSNASGVSS